MIQLENTSLIKSLFISKKYEIIGRRPSLLVFFLWKLVGSRIATCDIVIDLPLAVGEKRAGANSEELVRGPLVVELFLHERQPDARILGRAYATRRLEAHFEAVKR